MTIEAMRQALTVLEEIADEVFSPYDNKLGDAILALRAAIKQAQTQGTHWEGCGAVHPECRQPLEQEPVAWLHNDIEGNVITHQPSDIDRHPERWTPLYTTPRQWQGLTDEEIDALWRDQSPYYDYQDFASAIEAKLKERNHA